MRTRRRRVVTLAVGGLLVIAGCTGAGPSRDPDGPAGTAPPGAPPSLPSGPASSAAPADRSAGPVLGVVWDGKEGAETAELVWLHPLTLRPRPGRRLALGDHGVGWAVAPDQSLALLAGGGDSNDGRLLVVDPRRLRRLGAIRLREWWEWPFASSWVGRSRVVLAGSSLIDRPEKDLSAVVVTVVDPLERRVRSQRKLTGQLLASGRLPDGLVLLLGPPDGIAPTRLVVADGRGRVRAAPLPGIIAGFQEPSDWSSPPSSSRRAQPGLAVDPAGRRAFVVAAGAPVAEIDLATLGVAWHPLDERAGLVGRLADWLLPAAEAKSVHGPVRLAAWLGNGLLAVWGHDDSRPAVHGPTVEQWRRPAGLQVIDTRSWTATTIDPRASGAVVARGRLLSFGRLVGPPATPDTQTPTVQGYGLTVFGPGNRRPVHLFGAQEVIWLQVNGDRAYVDLTATSDFYANPDPFARDRQVGVVDLASNRVIARWRGRLPQLLVGGCCDEPSGW
jgi:hypothetical protein